MFSSQKVATFWVRDTRGAGYIDRLFSTLEIARRVVDKTRRKPGEINELKFCLFGLEDGLAGDVLHRRKSIWKKPHSTRRARSQVSKWRTRDVEVSYGQCPTAKAAKTTIYDNSFHFVAGPLVVVAKLSRPRRRYNIGKTKSRKVYVSLQCTLEC